MKSFLRILACSIFCVFAGGYSTGENEPKADKKPEDLLKTTWSLVSITTDKGVASLPDQHGITMAIDENGRVSGKSGVNRYFGSVSIVKGKLAWSPMGCTMMAGPPEMMEAEGLFLKSIAQTTTYEIDQGVLTFSDAATKTKVVMKAAANAVKPAR